MSPATRALARPLRSLLTARRTYATLPTKNPTPSGPIEPSQTQAHPIGAFYEAILNTPKPLPKVKPEEPATTVKENQKQQPAAAAAEPSEPAAAAAAAAAAAPTKRSRKSKAAAPKTEPASTATAATAPTASANKSSVSSSSSSSFSGAATPTAEPSTQEKAKVIFGSSLAGPAERAERLAQIRLKSTVVAGVVVPPKPEEPDNCCMSGCVNCVWERFRDEMEGWAAANAEAQRRVAAAAEEEASTGSEEKEVSRLRKQPPTVDHTTVSMDDDGGGSETNWDMGAEPAPTSASGSLTKDFWDEELYKNVPVGIREFMKQEKRLKEKHVRDGTLGGNGG